MAGAARDGVRQQDGDLVQMVSSRDKMGMLTPNDSTTYLLGFWNLERTGPMVIDYPKGATAGGILDMWQRSITDMGLSGPDKGEGGKYLILPPGQKAPRAPKATASSNRRPTTSSLGFAF